MVRFTSFKYWFTNYYLYIQRRKSCRWQSLLPSLSTFGLQQDSTLNSSPFAVIKCVQILQTKMLVHFNNMDQHKKYTWSCSNSGKIACAIGFLHSFQVWQKHQNLRCKNIILKRMPLSQNWQFCDDYWTCLVRLAILGWFSNFPN